MTDYEEYLDVMSASTESLQLLIDMTTEIIERELEYLDRMIGNLQDEKLFMLEVMKKCELLKANLAEHRKNVEQFVEDEKKETIQ